MAGPKIVLRGQPLHVRVQWWALTVVAVTIVLPFLGLALINPFWFREWFFEVVDNFARELRDLRDSLMKSQLDKYKLFDNLKEFSQ